MPASREPAQAAAEGSTSSSIASSGFGVKSLAAGAPATVCDIPHVLRRFAYNRESIRDHEHASGMDTGVSADMSPSAGTAGQASMASGTAPIDARRVAEKEASPRRRQRRHKGDEAHVLEAAGIASDPPSGSKRNLGESS